MTAKTLIPINSHSLMELVCHRRYWYKVVKGLTEKKLDAVLLVGKAIHKYAQLKGSGADEKLAFETVFKMSADPDDQMFILGGIGAIKSAPMGNVARDESGKALVEVQFDIPLAEIEQYDIRLQGTLDRIDFDGTMVEVVDWKSTRKWKLEQVLESYRGSSQFDFYYYVIARFGKEFLPPHIMEAVSRGMLFSRVGVIGLTKKPPKVEYDNPRGRPIQFIQEFEKRLLDSLGLIVELWQSESPPDRTGWLHGICGTCPFKDVCFAADQHEYDSAMMAFEVKPYRPLEW